MQTFSTRRASTATRKKQEKNSIKKLAEKGAKNMARAAKSNKPKKEYSLDDLSPELREMIRKMQPEQLEDDVVAYEEELKFNADAPILPWNE